MRRPRTNQPITLTGLRIHEFRETVYAYYRDHGRRFPWREPDNAYDVLVSEVMLQQTQADRVVPKYLAFMEAYPTPAVLAKAPLQEVLKLWQGLGYNRRAVMLKQAAEQVVTEHGGRLPDSEAELLRLPGVGPYTAAAVAAFAGNRPAMVIETNIRSVFIHEFFGDREGITDREIIPLIEQTVDSENPREWYSALMDYGAMLKKSGVNPGRRSAHYARQTPFAGSTRQLRGRLLKTLLEGPRTPRDLAGTLACDEAKVRAALGALETEGVLRRRGRRYAVAS